MNHSHESKLDFKQMYLKSAALVSIAFCCKEEQEEVSVESFPYSTLQ